MRITHERAALLMVVAGLMLLAFLAGVSVARWHGDPAAIAAAYDAGHRDGWTRGRDWQRDIYHRHDLQEADHGRRR